MKVWTSNGKSGMTMGENDLDAAGKALLATCRKSYDQNKADRKALAAHLSKVAGSSVDIRFTFGGNFNVFPAKAEKAKATESKVTLADWLKTQTA